jgi:hypothetical protein
MALNERYIKWHSSIFDGMQVGRSTNCCSYVLSPMPRTRHIPDDLDHIPRNVWTYHLRAFDSSANLFSKLLVIWKERWITGYYQHSTASEEGELFLGVYKATRALGVKPSSPDWWLESSSPVSPLVLLPSPPTSESTTRYDLITSEITSYPGPSDDLHTSYAPPTEQLEHFFSGSEPPFFITEISHVPTTPPPSLGGIYETLVTNSDCHRELQNSPFPLAPQDEGRYLEGYDPPSQQGSLYYSNFLPCSQSNMGVSAESYESSSVFERQLERRHTIPYSSHTASASALHDNPCTATNPAPLTRRHSAEDWVCLSGDAASSLRLQKPVYYSNPDVPPLHDDTYDQFMQQFSYESIPPRSSHTFNDMGYSTRNQAIPLLAPPLADLFFHPDLPIFYQNSQS